MKRIITITLSAICGTIFASAQPYTYPSPYEVSRNVQPARSEFLSYRNIKSAWGNHPDSTANFANLAGQWSYTYLADSRSFKPSVMVGMDVKLDGWKKITMPSCGVIAEARGDGFSPKNTPIMEANPERPGRIESVVLARDISIPFDYMDRAVYLHLGATSGAAEVYINDSLVGTRTDSRVPSDFNITPYMERGMNRLTVKIDRFNDANYLEMNRQDVFSGITGDTYIFAQPPIRVFDLMMTTTLDPTYKNGLLQIAMLLKTEKLNHHTVTVYYDLFDPQGKLVNQEFKDVAVGMREQDTVRFLATIIDVERWSAENPELYTVMFRIKREGRWTEYITSKVGFRTVETREKELLVNGRPARLNGVNADMFPVLTSDCAKQEELLTELQTLRHAGINALRTPYPLRSAFYDMADSLGFYVISNANISSRGLSKSIMKGGGLANNPAWRVPFITRATDAYEYGKTHASIIAWGLGDDAGNGYNAYQAARAIADRDSTRLIVNDAGAEWNTALYMPAFPKENVAPKYVQQPYAPSRVDNIAFWKSLPMGGFLSLPNTPSTTLSQSVTPDVTIKQVDAKRGIYKITNNLRYTNLGEHNLRVEIYSKKGALTTTYKIPLNIAPGESEDVEIKEAAGKIVTLTVGHLATYETSRL